MIPFESQSGAGNSTNVENLIASNYSKGVRVSNIYQEINQFVLSTSAISRVTERIIEDTIAWENRQLEPVYLMVWMDGIVFKVRENPKGVKKRLTWHWLKSRGRK